MNVLFIRNNYVQYVTIIDSGEPEYRYACQRKMVEYSHVRRAKGNHESDMQDRVLYLISWAVLSPAQRQDAPPEDHIENHHEQHQHHQAHVQHRTVHL